MVGKKQKYYNINMIPKGHDCQGCQCLFLVVGYPKLVISFLFKFVPVPARVGKGPNPEYLDVPLEDRIKGDRISVL